MWDWIDYFMDDGGEEDLELDFEPITRTKDPLADEDPVDVESDGDGDIYEDEDTLFEKKIKSYQEDPEMEVGFPEDKQEYEATPCLEEVIDEYESYTRGRALKPLKKGIGLMLHGDADFFNDSEVDE
ncbi:unnamed protein product [Moneuplotes crassus]|uniref:Uncharacterized protein n=1 Tax=Euplotes crassus TaxID=5936 RepID=A0AAD1Y1U3_EUPCR|nr:unnamed protein product [Moneuplotes crassus]|eukprot:CAMPEP_0197004374 /NCGR_PEP_ID=MMETSP1380-20130617/21876_1 /TAXON_ID=5936 /ORGANISM="Euplotes crassus, Strain CT5" /LENGTH=126 /DNA_ID=CAMNT_0042423141 /DNA_START=12 /DNA_END=392 /DNA_ORIENTATION=+